VKTCGVARHTPEESINDNFAVLFTFLMEVEKFNKENGKLTFC
jgi:hypothetical protein